MGEGETISGAYLAVDKASQIATFAALREMPRVAGTMVRETNIKNFKETLGETLLIFTFINTLLASTIAFGVVYNSAQIMLSERSRELASLRVLGLTRAEISYIMLGELGILTLTALPLGDGFRVEARFILWEGDNVMQVPTNTLFRQDGNWAVFIVEEARARLRPVKIGHQNGVAAEIVSGLSEGDLVITHPNDTIEEGTGIRLE